MAIIVLEFTAEENKKGEEEKMKKKQMYVLIAIMTIAISAIPAHAVIYQFQCPPECHAMRYWFCTQWDFFGCDLVCCWTPPPGGGGLDQYWGNCR